jgi:MFS family permease
VLVLVDRPSRAAARARTAVAALFFTNGALFANLVTRYPDLKADLGLSNVALGSAVAAYGLGALVVGLVAAPLVHRWGSARVAPLGTIAVAINLLVLVLAPAWVVLAFAFLLAGTLDVVVDVAENAHGLRVERRYGRSILNAFHGWWSVGAVAGGAMGAAAAGLEVPLVGHMALAAVIAGTIAAIASRLLLPGHDGTERLDIEGPHVLPLATLGRRHIARSVLAFGLIAAMAQVMEDASATWAAVYLREELGAVAAVSGLGFVALQTFQTIGRLSGDRFVTRHGDRAVARVGAVLAGGAMAAALLVPTTLTTIAAFGAVGLGIGTFIPAGLRAADELPGLPRGLGLTLVGTVLRVAVFAVPPLIGVLADTYSLRAALVVMPAAAVVVLLLSRALPVAPRRASAG